MSAEAMIPAALVAVSAIMWALMDTLAFHRSASPWRNASDFWTVDKGGFLPLTRYRWNAWHLAKSANLASLLGLMVIARHNPVPVNPWLLFFAAGALWIVVFNLFFDHIFKRK